MKLIFFTESPLISSGLQNEQVCKRGSVTDDEKLKQWVEAIPGAYSETFVA